jgi:hypothetical protein
LFEDIHVFGAEGLFQTYFSSPGAHRGHHDVPDAHASQKQGGAYGYVDKKFRPPENPLHPAQAFPWDFDAQLFGGLVCFNHTDYGRSHGSDIVQGGTAKIEPVAASNLETVFHGSMGK